MNVEVRAYQSQDLNDLLNAWEQASRLAHPFMEDAFFEQERDNIPRLYIPNTDTKVVTVDHNVVGFIALIAEETDGKLNCEIGGLFVHPSFHGKKLGKALVDKAMKLYGDLSVKVFKENTIGRAFYNKYGFEIVGELTWEETGDLLIEMKYSVI